jgi:hypothetical protein
MTNKKSNDNGKSRSPAGMTARKATATRKATARKADARGAKTHLLYRLTFGKTKG